MAQYKIILNHKKICKPKSHYENQPQNETEFYVILILILVSKFIYLDFVLSK